MELRGALALVTGGNGSLGSRICNAFAVAGADVAIVCRSSKDAAEEVAEGLRKQGVRAEVFLGDVTVPEQVTSLAERVLASFGRIDVLVNNAAYNYSIPFPNLAELTPEIWDQIMTANATGPFLMMREIGPRMKQQGGGRIVNISSLAGHNASGSSIAYAVSKSALNHLTRCMAVALAPEVLVNCVSPGLLEGTRMTGRLLPAQIESAMTGAVLKRTVDCDDVADQVVTFARTDSTTGQTVVIDSGRYFH